MYNYLKFIDEIMRKVEEQPDGGIVETFEGEVTERGTRETENTTTILTRIDGIQTVKSKSTTDTTDTTE